MEVSHIQNCTTRNVKVAGEAPTETEDPGRRRSERS